MVGRPNSTVKPASPGPTRCVTSLVLTSSVPRPWTPVLSCGTMGSLNARLTIRGHSSSCSVMAAVGQTSGSGSKRQRSQLPILRTARTIVGLRCSVLMPRKQV